MARTARWNLKRNGLTLDNYSTAGYHATLNTRPEKALIASIDNDVFP